MIGANFRDDAGGFGVTDGDGREGEISLILGEQIRTGKAGFITCYLKYLCRLDGHRYAATLIVSVASVVSPSPSASCPSSGRSARSAAFKSAVFEPSTNCSNTGCNNARPSSERRWLAHSAARSVVVRNSQACQTVLFNPMDNED